MSNLFTPATQNWVSDAIQRHSKGIFGELKSAIIWVDARNNNGELLVPIDPIKLVAEINNENPYMILDNHDLGKPKGQILESANFESEDGRRFIVAILGFYVGGEVLDFQGLEIDKEALTHPPKRLPVLPDGCWIEFATDPREVDAEWLDLVTCDSPLPIKRTELSHNAADSLQELIRVSLPYFIALWNPFTTSIASEAGKNVYAATHAWVKKLLAQLAYRRKPILAVYISYDGCQVSFLFRDKNVKQHYAAHDALPNAFSQAMQLITKLKAQGRTARDLNYEYDKESLKWFPSYAILNNNQIIVDNCELIAIEQLPSELSLGVKL